jgi:hypothetical protein
MSNNELYKQAIADAKSLKEITIEKAKQQIAETFTPKIQEMFRLKVNELEEEMGEEGKNMDHGKHMEEENYSIDEATLDEILAELQADEDLPKAPEEHGGIKGGLVGEEEGEDGIEESLKEAESKEEEEKEDEKEEGKEEGEHEAEEVAELSVEEFKELVRDVVADVLAGNTGEEEGIEGIDGLDGIDAEEGGEDDSLSLDEILAELQEEEAIEEAKKHKGMEKHEEKHEEKEKMEEELSTALATIAELRSSINEMNLFNAKLLYSSKILESRNLSATQKAKVLKAFDAAKNTSEVKQTYKVLNEAYEAPSKKQSIKESIGFASKPMGNAPAKPIVETDAFATRMQQLAGIIKPKI